MKKSYQIYFTLYSLHNFIEIITYVFFQREKDEADEIIITYKSLEKTYVITIFFHFRKINMVLKFCPKLKHVLIYYLFT